LTWVREANECCLEAAGEIKRELDTFFAIALEIEMHHHRRRTSPAPCSFGQARASRKSLQCTPGNLELRGRVFGSP
jgi:hypothetical protein